MAGATNHLAELLKLSVRERADAARALLDSLDDEGADADADADAQGAQVAELVRRMHALESGEVQLIDSAEVRARVMARLRAVRSP